MAAAERLWKLGVPFNTLNQRFELGFDPVPGGDTGYLPMNLYPVGSVAASSAREPGRSGDRDAGDEESGAEADEEESEPGAGRKFLATGRDDEERKAAIWHRYDERRTRWEEQFARAVAAELLRQAEDDVAAIRRGELTVVPYVYLPASWFQAHAERMRAVLRPLITAVVRDFAEAVAEAVFEEFHRAAGQPFDRKQAPEVVDPWLGLALAVLDAWSVASAHAVTTATASIIVDAVRTGLQEARTTDQIAQRIAAAIGDQRRAYRIARTEVGRASNAGICIGAAALGVTVASKEWLSSRDPRVRPDHHEMDGEVVPYEERFTMPDGSKMAYPGDRSGVPRPPST